jgi:DNA-binding LytR/AlgR family response regulator
MKLLKELQPHCKKSFQFEEIVRIEAIENYSKLTHKDGRVFIFARTLGNYETNLGWPFLRVNRSCLINIKYITQKYTIENNIILMERGKEFRISRRRRETVKVIINALNINN